MIAQAHRVGDAGLTVCSSGNISWRVGDEVLLSGTGSWVPSLPKEKVAICKLETGEVLNGVKPSMESGFHTSGCECSTPFPVAVRYSRSLYAGTAEGFQCNG